MSKTDFAFYIGVMVWITTTFYILLLSEDFHLSIVLGIAFGIISGGLAKWFYDIAIKKDC
ncbi:hypothetical protein [Staphylococcus shinii]|uniref:hypothetical protein n=1 Tax=Staphylococcus shinii TaxID=2912228 RepID=UPI003EEDEDB2